MSDAHQLLEFIEEGLNIHGEELGGWTQLLDEQLKIFDGRVTLSAEIHEMESPQDGMVHCHVFAQLHDYDDEVLDACVFGMGDDRENALREASVLWITLVAGPIRSFLDNHPVCMACQIGVAGGNPAEGFIPSDFGLPRLRAYVGPTVSRGIEGNLFPSDGETNLPWFRYASESAAPRRVHLAKATVLSNGKNGWHRELEIDGHDISHRDDDWPLPANGPEFGYIVRFAVFEFPQNSSVVRERAELERTIQHFAEHFSDHESIDQLIDAMVERGFDSEIVQEVESISTIAFGRLLFESTGVQYASTVIRAKADGTIETDVPLMSLPAYSRGRALGIKLRESLPSETWEALNLYNAESNAILSALEQGVAVEDLGNMRMAPSIVPEVGTSSETMDKALKIVNEIMEKTRPPAKKPWWKFW
ncbi:hypothetical protein [Bremerella cremea]|uniref:hypothetical protein n=1 Tax=Bremerella cremea TaxID=1031537 RepID=UPI0031EC1E93